MGYIPGLLVIFGACFLWGILVQNTLKVKRDFLLLQLNKLKEAVAERDRVIQALFNEVPPLDLAEINSGYLVTLQSLSYSFNDKFLSEELKAGQWTEKIIESLKAKGYPSESLELLSDSSAKVRLELKGYQKAVKSYNELIESKPTSFMANMLKFDKVVV